jgi:hypothetical protein
MGLHLIGMHWTFAHDNILALGHFSRRLTNLLRHQRDSEMRDERVHAGYTFRELR